MSKQTEMSPTVRAERAAKQTLPLVYHAFDRLSGQKVGTFTSVVEASEAARVRGVQFLGIETQETTRDGWEAIAAQAGMTNTRTVTLYCVHMQGGQHFEATMAEALKACWRYQVAPEHARIEEMVVALPTTAEQVVEIIRRGDPGESLKSRWYGIIETREATLVAEHDGEPTR